MTPVLMGRWQTRLFVMTVFGIPLTIPFAVLGLITTGVGVLGPFVALSSVTGIGLILDVGYDTMQQKRWDHDWPTWLQVVAGVVEGLLSGAVACCPLVCLNGVAVVLFPLHYGIIWLAGFLFVQGPIYVVFPRWRYRGGQIV
jgi:hypothetical protein